MDVEIQSLSKRGDGVVKMGRYIMYVAEPRNPAKREDQDLTDLPGRLFFTERAE